MTEIQVTTAYARSLLVAQWGIPVVLLLGVTGGPGDDPAVWSGDRKPSPADAGDQIHAAVVRGQIVNLWVSQTASLKVVCLNPDKKCLVLMSQVEKLPVALGELVTIGCDMNVQGSKG